MKIAGPFSRFCECLSRFPRLARGVAAACLALAAGGAVAAAQDDYQRGAQAYRTGDVVAATAALRRAADAGHAPAQALLGSILDHAEFNAEALAWYRKAAEQGDAGGEFGIGSMYLSGEGVERDLAQAYRWLTRAAESNHQQAVIALANAYVRSERGELPQGPDPARAGEWLRKAASLDSLAALDALAAAHRTGGFDLPADVALAGEYAARASAIRRKMAPEKGRKKK